MNFKNYKAPSLLLFVAVLILLYTPLTELLVVFLSKWEVLSSVLTYIGVFSVMTLLSATLWLVDRYGYRKRIFKWLVDVPNLSGRYTGTLVSNYQEMDGFNTERACAIEVKQNASAIHVYSYIGDPRTFEETSQSYSASEQLVKEENGFFKLYYVYTNEPDTLMQQLDQHNGTAMLKYYPDVKMLKGDYYNKRGNQGTIEVRFEQKDLIGRLIK